MNNADMPAMPPNAGWRDDNFTARGLTKREYFAGLAMQGFASDPSMNEVELERIADLAVVWAEALLERLEATK